MPKVAPEHLESRRRQIVAAAIRLFADRGPAGTSMHDVIAASGMSAGAVYHYFPTKKGLVAAVGAAVAEAYATPLGNLRDGALRPPAEVVELLARSLDDLHAREIDITRFGILMWSEALRDPDLFEEVAAVQRGLRDALVDLARRWQEAGMISPDVDPQAIAQALYALQPGYTLQLNILGGVCATALVEGVAALGRALRP